MQVMNPEEHEFKLQSQFGCPYNKDDVIHFMVSLHNPDMVVCLQFMFLLI